MPGKTIISWTGKSWNRGTGCTKVGKERPAEDGRPALLSPCTFCYASTFAEKWRGIPGHPYENGFDITEHNDRTAIPLRWTKPVRIFVNSMSDLFHSGFSTDWVDETFAVMVAADWHIFQVLTKRWRRMREYYNDPGTPERIVRASERLRAAGMFHNKPALTSFEWPAPHIWQGISVGTPEAVYAIHGFLTKTNAAVRWISFEPLLDNLTELHRTGLVGVDWAVTGGESGTHLAGGSRGDYYHRWLDHKWARTIRDVAVRDGVAFFHKQDSDVQSELRPWLLEVNGTAMSWQQFPGVFTPPTPVYQERLIKDKVERTKNNGERWFYPAPDDWLWLGRQAAEYAERFEARQRQFDEARSHDAPPLVAGMRQSGFDLN